jgi:Transposase
VPGKPQRFTPEFKEQAVKMVVSSSPPRPIAHVARELGINDTTLGFLGEGRPGRVDQPHRQRMDDLPRQVLHNRARPPATAHQHLPDALSATEVQAATPVQEGPDTVEVPDRKAATPIRPLGLAERVLTRLWIRRAE